MWWEFLSYFEPLSLAFTLIPSFYPPHKKKKKKHYHTLNGYRDRHKPIPSHAHSFEEVRAWYCTSLAKKNKKFHLTCVSVYECVLCVFILFSIGVEVLLAKRSLLLLFSSLVSRVQGKADWQTDWWHSCNAQPPFFNSNQFEVFSKNDKRPLQIILIIIIIIIVINRFSS